MQNEIEEIQSTENGSDKAWVVTANMGYGHQRAVYPLKEIADGGIITVGTGRSASKEEEKLWKRLLNGYEFMSRAKGIPVIGNPLFNILDSLMYIPTSYPIRDLSNKTLQVLILESTINKGLCTGLLDKVRTKNLPFVTSFYATAIAADMKGFQDVYCIICDADINRVWVAKEPWDSKIHYFVPCGKAAQRLKAYGVQDERILITGFPLPVELLGDKELTVLKTDLAQRLDYLDPQNIFWARNKKNVKHFLGKENCVPRKDRKLTLMYAVGGAGAQKEIGEKIAFSLKKKILNDEIKLVLVAGIRKDVHDFFTSVKSKITDDASKLEILYSDNLYDYFDRFNKALKYTDILWTKPSELSFYCALGIPVIIAPAIGAQEKFNQKWLFEVQAGIKQENPDYTDQWLYEMLDKGILAEAAWSGFLKARKLGTFKILDFFKNGVMAPEESPVLR
jgi:hypothetical protein